MEERNIDNELFRTLGQVPVPNYNYENRREQEESGAQR